MAVKITDVAVKAGVSKSTVSRFLNGRYEFMSADTKARIAAVIEELEYRPNAIARSLKQKRTNTITAVVANILNPFSTSIIRGVEDYCKQAGYNLILCNADDDPVKEREYLEMLLSKHSDGLVICTTERNNGLLQEIGRHMPMVIIGRKVPEVKADTITVDNREGIKLAISHLVSLGHREIAMFTLPLVASPRRERVEAYQNELRAHDVPLRDEFLVEVEGTDETLLAERLRAMLCGSGPKPSAILGGNDLITIALVKALKRLRVKMPRDVAIIGFDDWDWAWMLEPPLTVVAQPTYDMGGKAAELVIGRISGAKQSRKPSLVVYKPALITRKSCGE